MQLTTLLVHIPIILLLIPSIAIAAPALPQHSHARLIHPRQAIPDKTNQTETIPTPARSTTPSQLDTSCSVPLRPTITSSPPPRPTTPVPGNNGNSTPIGESDPSPCSCQEPLPATKPTFKLTTAAVASISAGSTALVCIMIALGLCLFSRRRVHVDEIPVRRSKLVFQLGFRASSNNPCSRNPSRREDGDIQEINDGRYSWDGNSKIGRPAAAWIEGHKSGHRRRDLSEGFERTYWTPDGERRCCCCFYEQ